MSTKAALKSAKAALDAGDYDKAIEDAQNILSEDAHNYFARLFLGRAYEKLGKLDEAAKAYEAGAKSKPDDSQAWLGLCSVYEAQGSNRLDGYREAVIRLVEIYGKADDRHRAQTHLDKFISFAKQHGTKSQYKRALEMLLPGSPPYEYLEGRIQSPHVTYIRLVELTEEEEAQTIKQEIGSRRTRVGATLGQVTTSVNREVFSKSDLGHLYQEVINWSPDDDVRREYEEKLLQRSYDLLIYSPADAKPEKLDNALTLAEGMVLIHHPFQLAWDLVLETRDIDDLRELDVHVLREYLSLFPNTGLDMILTGWLSSELSPFPAPSKESDTDGDLPKSLSPEDQLVLLTEGLSSCEQSPLAHRLVSEYYLHLDEHESAADTARAGLKAVDLESSKLGMSFQNTKDALNSVLATSLVHIQSPRHHPEARRLFENILQRKPKWTAALVGLGLIFEEREQYRDSIDFLSAALEQDSDNVDVGTELAWCRAQDGDYERARDELESYLSRLKAEDPRARDLRAQVLYRIGICTWELDSSKTARRDRNGAYASFLAAIKSNVNFAPAYTSLGIYYSDYSKDRKRGRQCFQKAFELSTAETDAAERLARSFADQGDWDIVEVISQRVIDSGRARPPPGSKRKGLSWPYSALGVVQMNKQEYQQAITSFLAALRISPDDYESYVSLGESYHNSGRYNSAMRTFKYALEPHEGITMQGKKETWFAEYMLANVHRELGEYDEAVAGLQNVLQSRPEEFGVLMSLLQTFVERAWRCVELGLFGQAIDSACEAIDTAATIAKDRPNALNMWKALGDATMIFTWVQSSLDRFPSEQVLELLNTGDSQSSFDVVREVDLVKLGAVQQSQDEQRLPLLSSILAFKRAIHTCSHDIHAQAVAWYNLGSAEYRAYVCIDIKHGRRYLKAAVRCFKRAIELEAGNAEFWNALGVATTILNPKVAQHSFVRSLHLNELNAKVWTNLGALYLSQSDHELAHESFGRAQAIDPDYAHAWLGEGLIAIVAGASKDALSHFTHAFDISDSTSSIVKRRYGLSVFDHVLSTSSASNDAAFLVQPTFALEQLLRQRPDELSFQHLAALFYERVGNYSDAITSLTKLCTVAEEQYEATESSTSLAHFAQAKADLARSQLASRQYQASSENAETALDLSSDSDNASIDAQTRTKLRLSTHITAGLSRHFEKADAAAISMFRSALQESDTNPDVVCSLVKVLWSHGGKEERSVARDQLFDCVEKHPDHVGSVMLLGAIAALEDDLDTALAIRDDLLAMRTRDGLTIQEQGEVERLLSSFAALSADNESGASILSETQAAVLLKPGHPRAWCELADLTGDIYASKMALKTTEEVVPPTGHYSSEGLANAFADVGSMASAQRSVMFAPWTANSWQSVRDVVST